MRLNAGTPTTLHETGWPMSLDKPRAALVVYHEVDRQPWFLLVSSRRNPNKLTLPGGKVGRHESPIEAAIRETREEAGVLTRSTIPLGQYPHQKRKRIHPTDTFLARYAGQACTHEPRTLCWVTIEGLARYAHQIRRPIVEQVQLAELSLRRVLTVA